MTHVSNVTLPHLSNLNKKEIIFFISSLNITVNKTNILWEKNVLLFKNNIVINYKMLNVWNIVFRCILKVNFSRECDRNQYCRLYCSTYTFLWTYYIYLLTRHVVQTKNASVYG